METRKQELLKELNKIRSKEVNEQLLNLENVEGSAIAQLELEKAKIDHKVKAECAKADHEIKVEEAKTAQYKVKQEILGHRNIMYGDFLIKLAVAAGVTAAFMHVVYTGNVDAMETNLIGETSGNGNFQLLSVLGPLFGMVLQYYFGKNKSGANGE